MFSSEFEDLKIKVQKLSDKIAPNRIVVELSLHPDSGVEIISGVYEDSNGESQTYSETIGVLSTDVLGVLDEHPNEKYIHLLQVWECEFNYIFRT